MSAPTWTTLLATVVLLAVPAAHAAGTTFRLDGDDHPDSASLTHADCTTNKCLEMTSGGADGATTVTVDTGPTPNGRVWATTNAAQTTFDFSGQSFTYAFTTATTTGPDGFIMRLATIDSSGQVTNAGSSVTCSSLPCSGTIQAASLSVAAGHYIAWRILDNAGGEAPNIATVVATDGSSTLTLPDSDPGFPVPEPASIALLAAGAIIVAFIATRRRATR